ncbi:MAG TPA: tetratricopeptide repeat protein [Anaerolineales bacterium]|nr:tetratricopeptide repeat protein [Anaerolineales bacterium]
MHANEAIMDMDPYDFDDLWDYGDPAGTAEKLRELLPEAEASGDDEYRLQLLIQLARTHSLRGELDAAHEILDRVEPQLSDATPVARIRYLLERGRSFNSAGEKDKAHARFIEAWDMGRDLRADFFAVDAAHMVAIAAGGDEGLEWNLKAIDFANASDQPRARNWLGSLYNNTGWSYHDRGEFEKALALFEGALQFREEQGNAETIRIAQWCVARCLRSLGRVDEAFEIQQAILIENETAGAADGYTHEELGELLLLMGQPDEASPHFAEAYAVLSQDAWLMENEAERIARMRRMGEDSPIHPSIWGVSRRFSLI